MSSRKRPSDTRVMESQTKAASSGGGGDRASSQQRDAQPSGRKTRLRVRIRRWHGVARWTWNCGDEEVCGICQSAFEGVAPGVKFPGDECPVVWGKCGHSFHLQCVSTWLGGRNTCPICRQDWEFGAERKVGEGNDDGAAEE